ncbi:hypothetical protein GW17_00056909 [Ensete ventricosum]|nr:hypothetical protein GW17_00056909 [Ensete ventricosum]
MRCDASCGRGDLDVRSKIMPGTRYRSTWHTLRNKAPPMRCRVPKAVNYQSLGSCLSLAPQLAHTGFNPIQHRFDQFKPTSARSVYADLCSIKYCEVD